VATGADLLDLTVLARAEKVRFDVVDSTAKLVGTVTPIRPCTIDNDSGQQIKRKLTGFQLASSDYASVNPLVHRIRPYWVLSSGDEYPGGVFMFADASSQRFSYGRTMAASLVDQSLLLSQQLAETLSFPSGTTAPAAILQTINAAGIFTANIATSSYTFGSATAYPAGTAGTTYAKVLADLCQNAGFYTPYFDNTGMLQVKATTSVASATPTLNYIDGGRIISQSMTESNDLLAAPNRFLVIDTSATTGAVAYPYTIPATAPHSFENRGFYITQVIPSPGVGDVTQAQAVGAAYYSSNPQAYETVVFSSPADPRHDTFDVINYRGTNYLETKWSIVCSPGGPMTHTAVRVYV
jgi:hypothetical protein